MNENITKAYERFEKAMKEVKNMMWKGLNECDNSTQELFLFATFIEACNASMDLVKVQNELLCKLTEAHNT